MGETHIGLFLTLFAVYYIAVYIFQNIFFFRKRSKTTSYG